MVFFVSVAVAFALIVLSYVSGYFRWDTPARDLLETMMYFWVHR